MHPLLSPTLTGLISAYEYLHVLHIWTRLTIIKSKDRMYGRRLVSKLGKYAIQIRTVCDPTL